MIELGVDGDLVTWTGSFLLDRKIQLVIDKYDNKKKEIKTGISQSFPLSPIFFGYISAGFSIKYQRKALWLHLSFLLIT